MVRFLAPQQDARHGARWGVTVLVRRQDGRANRSTQWFGTLADAWWFVESSCNQIRAKSRVRPEIVA